MRVQARLFAGTRDAVGASHVALDLPDGSRVRDLVDALCARHPRLGPYRPHLRLAQDGAFVAPDAPLRDGAEVALMPPVSGGSAEKVALHDGALALDPLVAQLERAGAGAVVAFLGVVRATSGERAGADVESLHFEAYAPLALAQMARVREDAIAKFGLADLLIRHRLGELPVGEPIVAVVAAAAHRRAAFEAAMWAMDELKTSVPIWKEERDRDGARAWVNDPTRT